MIETSAEIQKEPDIKPIVTLEQFISLDFESPISQLDSLDSHKLQSAYENAIKNAGSDNLKIHAYGLLASVLSFHYRPENRAEPYGPLIVWEGRRSAIPTDFDGPQSDVFGKLAEITKNIFLQTRLADTAWINNKKQSNCAALVLKGSTEIAQQLLDKKDEKNGDYFSADNYFHRALTLARATGWEKEDASTLRELIRKYRKKSISVNSLFGFERIAKLDLNFSVSDPKEIAKEAEELASRKNDEAKKFTTRLWELAAQAYDAVDLDADRDRCVVKIAEEYAAEGERASSVMVATHSLAKAIDTLRRVKGTRARRDELQTKLVERQKDIYEEMGRISTPIDLSEPIQKVEKVFNEEPFGKALAQFVNLDRSPDPDALRQEAEQSRQQYPLSSIFGGTVHDSEGKVILKHDGASFAESNDEQLKFEISKHEAMRRQVSVAGYIAPARRVLYSRFSFNENDLLPLMQSSPFIPAGQEIIFARGFAHFFAGGFLEAGSLLVPQLENSLRYVLRQIGTDITTMKTEMIQENITLSSILGRFKPEAEKVFGKSVIFDIEMVFDYPAGPMIRHNLAHGLLSSSAFWSFEMVYACWLIFRLICIPLFPDWKNVEEFYRYQD